MRLKGGDPFIFGRGGEEIEYLQQYDISCSVVPGITVAIGCASTTQIPLTHWDLALQKDSTVVFYMGLSNIGEITSQLIERGCPTIMPFAVVAKGTSNQQQVIVGTVSDIARKVQQTSVTSPALLIMGEVVSENGYAQKLYEQSLEQLISVASVC